MIVPIKWRWRDQPGQLPSGKLEYGNQRISTKAFNPRLETHPRPLQEIHLRDTSDIPFKLDYGQWTPEIIFQDTHQIHCFNLMTCAVCSVHC